MCAHAEALYPEECVGAMLGQGAVVQSTVPLSNVAFDRRSGFEISAREYLAIERQADAIGVQVLGFYHSHPDGLAQPSSRDVELAWPGWWTLIVPVWRGLAGKPGLFLFEPERGRFVEVLLASH